MSSLLTLDNLNVTYLNKKKRVYAAKNIQFTLNKGISLGIVGESGSGKSTLAMAILGLLPQSGAEVTGQALLNGQNLVGLSQSEYAKLRWKDIAAVFQKSMNALSPVHRISEQVEDIYRVHDKSASAAQIAERCQYLFSLVNLPARVYRLYPHELSGGMLQRVCIAISLLFNPKLLILDEATTALDVVTQGQILEEILEIEKEFDMARITITHDMSVVAESCQQVAIMYAGEIMEIGWTKDVLSKPKHPYTIGLLASFPSLKDECKILKSIPGFLPDLSRQSTGCIFAARCPQKMEICTRKKPTAVKLEDTTTYCHLYGGVTDV